MEERKHFGLNKKVAPGNLNVTEIVEAMRKQERERMNNETTTDATPVEVQLRFRKGDQESANNTFRLKTTVQCGAPGANPENFNFGDATVWGEASPLFDEGYDPTEGREDIDEIVYSKLAKLNEKENTTRGKDKGETHKVNRSFVNPENKFYSFLNLAFKVMLLGVFGLILYAVYNSNLLHNVL